MQSFDSNNLSSLLCPAIDAEISRIHNEVLSTTIWKTNAELEFATIIRDFYMDQETEDDLTHFIRTPISGDLAEVPGMTISVLDSLSSDGVNTTYQLIAKYLELKQLSELMEEHHIRFLNYLGENDIDPQTCYIIMRSIGEKVSTMIPGLYDPSIFAE